MGLTDLNRAAAEPNAHKEGSTFYQALLHCCGSKCWVEKMHKKFPCRDLEALWKASDEVDAELTRDDWLEAFAAHPRIGRAKQSIKEWEAQEQQATKTADETTLDLLEDLNDQYYEKFGYIYIVCATGKSAEEMLRILQSRIGNNADEELPIAAREQSKISKLRLEKLLQQNAKMTTLSTTLVQKLQEKQQAHVLKFYEAGKLTESEAIQLSNELESLDLDWLKAIFDASTKAQHRDANVSNIIEPLEEFDLLEDCPEEVKSKWLSLGLEAISKHEVCALVLSGGQGTRLGFPGPKGMYNIGLPSEKSLFQLFAERILKLQSLAAFKFGGEALIPFFVMTSPMNHDETVAYFRQHRYFGLNETQMFFFSQGTLPCFTMDGKLMLENSHKLATASDGNGGIYKALASSGALAKMQKEGVKYLHVFSVDNALCKVVDPTFIGYCIDKDADCGNKVVWKSRPSESVGVVAKKNGKFCIIEYSEMDKAASELVDPKSGKLAFGAANICNHFFTTDFLVNVVLPNMSLEYHVAQKKIPIANEDGVTFVPTVNSGIKLESFIFDVFPLSSRMAVLSVPRESEFAPVKNPPKNPIDSPDSARQMLREESKAWIIAAARTLLSGEELDEFITDKLNSARDIEISPLVSYNGEGLDQQVLSLKASMAHDVIRFESQEHMATYSSIPPSVRKKFEDANQAHLFRFVDSGSVTAHDASQLVESLRPLDPVSLGNLFERSTRAVTLTDDSAADIEPLGDNVVHILGATQAELKDQWREHGLSAISKGMVGALVLSGGQGTRLGFQGPKGMYDIGLPSGKSLFEIFALRISKVQELAQAHYGLKSTPTIPWLIMTSEMNHDETIGYFRNNKYFGLLPSQVHFFCQGTLPCFTNDGRFILETPSQLSRASDGNGGIYPALKRSGMLQYLTINNVHYLHVFSVDNALCKVVDPIFIGYCIDKNADCANKVVWKDRPDESVGVVARKNGKYCVVEYSELDKTLSELRDPATGELRFGAANICNHFFRLDFLKYCCNLEDVAAYHVAKKKISYVDENGKTVFPTVNSGIKLETFIFDVFQHSKSMKVLGTSRNDEFAPVKNAPGAATDSPDTARHLISEQCKRWLINAGATFDDTTNGLCEILPTLSYDGEGLEEIARSASPIRLPVILERS